MGSTQIDLREYLNLVRLPASVCLSGNICVNEGWGLCVPVSVCKRVNQQATEASENQCTLAKQRQKCVYVEKYVSVLLSLC